MTPERLVPATRLPAEMRMAFCLARRAMTFGTVNGVTLVCQSTGTTGPRRAK